MSVFGKVLDQLMRASLLKINPIIDLSGDSLGLGNFCLIHLGAVHRRKIIAPRRGNNYNEIPP